MATKRSYNQWELVENGTNGSGNTAVTAKPGAVKKPCQEVALPAIQWANDNSKLIWSLLTEIEKPENFRVLFGKRNKSEVCVP